MNCGIFFVVDAYFSSEMSSAFFHKSSIGQSNGVRRNLSKKGSELMGGDQVAYLLIFPTNLTKFNI